MFIILLASIVIVSIATALSGSTYAIRFATNYMMWIALAQSLNTITGYVGRVDFGHVLFFGIGAYATAYLYLNGVPWYIALLAAPAAAALAAVILGFPTLRLHGAYFAIATWSFAEAMKQIVYNTEALGSSFGLPIPPTLGYISTLALMTLVAIFALSMNWAIERSRLGLAFNAIRGNELVASTAGVDVVRYRVLAYALSAIPAALAGGIYTFWISYVYPDDVFHGLKTDQMFVMTLLGGAGSFIGVFIGTTIVSIVYEILWTFFSEQLYLVFLGVMLMAIVVFMPNGVAHYMGLRTYSARRLLYSLIPPQLLGYRKKE
ncbi:MAG: branched-chain amino acid ABC transporter permease [Desulfurococcales archaeon]|nr:branched-chain amino acid ABC transporter permease [Desulfurococcales archaeon]